MFIRTLRLEALESRDNPGAYTSALTAGHLTLTGTDDAESIAVRDDGAGVTIIAQAGTTVDGQASKSFAGPISAIEFVAKGGDDAVSFDDANPIEFSGGIDVDLGDSSSGGNVFDLSADVPIALGRVRLKAADGFDTATLSGTTATVAHNFRADFGDGGSSLILQPGTTILGHLLVDAGAGADTVSVSGTAIHKDFAFAGGDGPAEVTTLTSPSTVQGDVTVWSRDDQAALNNFAGVTSQGDWRITGRTGAITSTAPLAARSVTVTGPDGAAVTVPSGSVGDDVPFSVSHDLSVTARNGEGAVFIQGGTFEVGGKLTASGVNPSASFFSAGDVTLGGDVLVSGDAVAAFWHANAGLAVGGRLTVRSDGLTILYLHPTTGTLAEDVTVQGALWATGVDVFGDLTFGGDLTVTGGTSPNPDIFGGSTTVVIESPAGVGVQVEGDFAFTSRERGDVVILTNVAVRGRTTIDTGAGDDFILLDGGTWFGGPTGIDAGAGDDQLLFGRTAGLLADAVTFGGRTTIDAGAGNDRLELGLGPDGGGDAHSRVVFDSPDAVIDGGPGLNLFVELLSQFTGSPDLTNWVVA